MLLSPSNRSSGYKPLLFAYCVFALGWITLLLFAGGFTTSIKAGMAFLDWPLSNGSINPEGWTTQSDMAAEHSHRLLGMIIGNLSIGLFIWTWIREDRAWIRNLSRMLIFIVILQGLLGGGRVLFDQLNIKSDHNLVAQTFAVAHACGAMIVLALLVTITIGSSKSWIGRNAGLTGPVPISIRRCGIWATSAVFIQILIGAIMRHADAGLAIVKFPLSSPGSFLPAYWNFDVGIHFAHRIGAIVVTVLLISFVVMLLKDPTTRKAFKYGAISIILILIVQIYLGALTIWSVKNPYVATIHHLVGAFLLASTYGLTFLTHHHKFAGQKVR